jgi:hypothetical protein
MTTARRVERPRVERGAVVSDGEALGLVHRVDRSPSGHEDVYVLWLPLLPDETP